MTDLLLKRRAWRQPQGALQVDWGNPIAQGLCLVALNGQNLSALGVIGGKQVTFPYASGSSQVVNSQGVASQATNYLYDTGATGIVGNNYSLLVVGNCTSTSAIQNAVDDDVDTGSPRCFQFRVNAGKAELITFDTSSNPYFATAPAMSATKLASGFVIGAAVAGNSIAVYQGGTKTANTAAGTQRVPSGSFRLGGHKGSGGSSWGTGGLNLVLGWNRTLSDTEMQSLADNPWQLFRLQSMRLQLSAAGTNTNISPGVAVLALTGYAPSLTQTDNRVVTPAPAGLTLTGYAPSFGQTSNQIVAPGAAALNIVGFAPSITQSGGVTITPGTATLSIAGYAPTFAQPKTISPGAASLTLSGFAPSITQTAAQYVSPGAAVLMLTGYAPTITQSSQYARAPAGAGYSPGRDEATSRPEASGGGRQAATQRNQR
ncbi:hypothetical protein AB4Z19_15575 [Pseudoduganella sp. RAF19]|uniref:hypothetical protein n=2 Tax=cellular organisms TaxID=131567 RepID=UPI003F96A38C